jgi:hypothetical protein
MNEDNNRGRDGHPLPDKVVISNELDDEDYRHLLELEQEYQSKMIITY